MNGQKKNGIQRCGQMCENALAQAALADKRGDSIDADYWRSAAIRWSSSAFEWVTL